MPFGESFLPSATKATVDFFLLFQHVTISDEQGLPLIPQVDFLFSIDLLVLHVCLVKGIKHRRE